ncbi:MAG: transposase [Defluviitaleaceae bacterium]|nr:transposase [Defluviitaleaceae bacterium]
MRWRIEEYYRFKKQGYGFEKFLVRSLDSIRNLDLLLSMAIGYIGTLSEKVEESIEVVQVIVASKRLYGIFV